MRSYYCNNLFTGYISDFQNEKSSRITWCTLNAQEQSKCLNLSAAVNRDRSLFYIEDFMELVCKQVNSYLTSFKNNCTSKLLLGQVCI